MSPGPLRRTFGALGLVALAAPAWMLARGVIEPRDAAIRAAVTLLVVIVLSRLAGWWLTSLAESFEKDAEEAGRSGTSSAADAVGVPEPAPLRRADDPPVDEA